MINQTAASPQHLPLNQATKLLNLIITLDVRDAVLYCVSCRLLCYIVCKFVSEIETVHFTKALTFDEVSPFTKRQSS